MIIQNAPIVMVVSSGQKQEIHLVLACARTVTVTLQIRHIMQKKINYNHKGGKMNTQYPDEIPNDCTLWESGWDKIVIIDDENLSNKEKIQHIKKAAKECGGQIYTLTDFTDETDSYLFSKGIRFSNRLDTYMVVYRHNYTVCHEC